MKIVYTGPSDFQEFSKADFAKASIEHNKIHFAKNVPQEVADEVAAALVSKDADESPIFYDYSFEEVEDNEKLAGELHGKELDKALEDAGLSKSGTVAEKQARLAEHLDEEESAEELA